MIDIDHLEGLLAAGTKLPDTGHSMRCGCLECAAAWKHGATFQQARSDIVKALPALLTELRAARSARERLVTVVDEAFGMQPVQESTEELLTTLDRLLFEDRVRAETAERELAAERRRTQEAIDAIRKLGRDGALDSILPGTFGAEVTGSD